MVVCLIFLTDIFSRSAMLVLYVTPCQYELLGTCVLAMPSDTFWIILKEA